MNALATPRPAGTTRAKIAIYDMDKTITRRPTYTRFLLHMARRRHPWRLALLPVTLVPLALYGLGLVGRARLKTVNQRLLLGGAPSLASLDRHLASFAETIAEKGVLADARARIAADRADGYRPVMATASYRLYAARIAAALGIEDVIATELSIDERQRLRPVIEGTNCYGAEKLVMVESWFAAEGLDRAASAVRAYSDHISDAPLLGWADEGFAVNPNDAFARLARERGWQTLAWD